jgi:EEF1A lysine methyltransferase 2
MDVLDPSQYPTKKFNLVIDKGTYDAIALSPVNVREKRYLYKDFVKNIINKDDGFFIITSCNWTTDELVAFFTENEGI